jgi:hypothetical protein
MFKLYFLTYVADVVASVTLNYQLIENSLEFEKASSLILFHCSGKECRPQEPCEFPESANILSSTSVYINQEFSKPANSI